KDPLGLMTTQECVMAGIGIGGIVGLVAGGGGGVATGPLVIIVSPVGALIGSGGGSITGGIVGAVLCKPATQAKCDPQVGRPDTQEEEICKRLLVMCLENPWQDPKRGFGPRKDCGSCYEECKKDDGAWPFYKCPFGYW